MLALVVAASVGVPGAHADHAGPLAGQWHLEERYSVGDGGSGGTPDSSGHGNDVVGYGAGTPNVAGRFGNAFDFSGTSVGWNSGEAAPALESQTVTLLAWVKATNPGPSRYIASKGSGGCAPASYGMYTGPFGSGLYFYAYDGTNGWHSPDAGSAPWDGNWHMVAGTFDGSRVRLYVDGVQVGDGTAASGPIKYDLAKRAFTVGGYEDAASCSVPTNFPGAIDEPRVYNRALSATEIARLAAHPGPDPPVLVPDGAGGGAGGGPGSGGDSVSQPPRVTALAAARPVRLGRASVLTAQVQGPAHRLEWNLRGDSRPEVVSSAGQTGLRLRLRPGPNRVEVRAVGPAGAGPPLAQTLTGPRALTRGLAGRVQKKLVQAPPVFAAGPSDVLSGIRTNFAANVCVSIPTTMRAGALEVRGCLVPIESLDDIPAPERGIVERLARQLGISTAAAPLERAIDLTDAYRAIGSVTVNGVKLTPEDGASIVLYPQANAIASSDARLRIGDLRLGGRRDFVLDTAQRAGQIALGSFPRLPGGLTKLGGFPLVGNVDVKLRAEPGAPAEALIDARLKLPEFLQRGGVSFESVVRLRATNAEGLVVDNMTVGPLDAELGGLSLQRVRLDYTRAGQEWRGQGKACLVSGACLDMIPPNGGVVIRNGALNFAGATLGFPPPGVPLFPGLALERIGFGFGLDPTRFVGNARVTALKIYAIDGRLLMAFPSDRVPYVFNRDEVGGSFPTHFYGRVHTRPTVAISADAFLKAPVVGDVKLGNGYFLYEYPGYVAFGGSADQGIAGVISVHGSIAGEFNASNGRYNLGGRVRGCLVDVICRGATGVLSSRGVGVCLEVGPVNVGGGVVYSPFAVKIWPLDGCRWSRFAEFNVRGARAGGPQEIRIGPGDRSRAIELKGAEAPRVRVTGPGGQALETPAGSGLVTRGALRIVRSERARITAVGLQDPRPGTYRIEPLAGAAAPRTIAQAVDPRPARARARVRGRGARRTLAYRVDRRANQRVTFVEVTAGGTERTIGAVDGGGRGRLAFAPAPGRGTSRVEARFELDRLPAERVVVARFRPAPPRLGRPARVRVRRAKSSLRVTWRRVPGATRYHVVATPRGGAQRIAVTRAPRATLRGVAPSSPGVVSVRALDALRRGRPARARFRAAVRRANRLAPLPRCRRRARLRCR